MHVLTRTDDLLILNSFPLISRYLSGDASDSDSGEDCADDDNNEPEENSNTKSESRLRTRSLTNPTTGKRLIVSKQSLRSVSEF